jgi:hypothetical protein
VIEFTDKEISRFGSLAKCRKEKKRVQCNIQKAEKFISKKSKKEKLYYPEIFHESLKTDKFDSFIVISVMVLL